jgi:hypothetical protein
MQCSPAVSQEFRPPVDSPLSQKGGWWEYSYEYYRNIGGMGMIRCIHAKTVYLVYILKFDQFHDVCLIQ